MDLRLEFQMASKTSAGVTKWQDVASEAQKHLDATIAPAEPALVEITEELPLRVISLPRKYMGPGDITITETLIEMRLASLAIVKLHSLAVTKAFLRRAAIAQTLFLARAKELDEHFAKNGPIEQLHGLPMSVKEDIGMKDSDNTCVLVGWIGRKNYDDANIFKILLAAGAVLYVRTNEPQGGSIRSPAAQCGLCGLRPTAFRLPLVGIAAPSMRCNAFADTIGPLSRSPKGIDLLMKSPRTRSLGSMTLITGPTPTDRLTIEVMWDDGILSGVVEKLKRVTGVQIIE
ncbi:hypothetical protein BOTCAL_0025g00210 [Botryotinia calthae]|uniref:Amidase domain-containing protein n=1 Tax=Botryotinia calthae TaxID=38488 RepID=A0A4Y8DEE4_9HELO|nr:hypothetical protein BOTCAL_0025g00210 [Botryotinia calthae]